MTIEKLQATLDDKRAEFKAHYADLETKKANLNSAKTKQASLESEHNSLIQQRSQALDEGQLATINSALDENSEKLESSKVLVNNLERYIKHTWDSKRYDLSKEIEELKKSILNTHCRGVIGQLKSAFSPEQIALLNDYVCIQHHLDVMCNTISYGKVIDKAYSKIGKTTLDTHKQEMLKRLKVTL